jgi:dinuclear metal center YbgI/SA1388 family protein
MAPRSLRAEDAAAFLDKLLKVKTFSDSAWNGLQFAGTRPVRKVAAAVDASLATFQAAQRVGADLLVVHHGLLWGKPQAWTGLHGQRLRALAQSGLSLYASHLPLDAHPVCGNNALAASALGLKACRSFGEYHGQTLGFCGRLAHPVSRKNLAERLAKILGLTPRVLGLGPEKISSVGIVSGGGGDCLQTALDAGQRLDAFITGEASHTLFHPCQEAGVNLFLGGHYATETLGVKALVKILEKKYGIQSIFLDLPTGM